MTLFSLITTLVAFGLLAPSGTVYADHWIDEMIESAKAGNGTVVESHSSASTGGQTAASGQTVTTGDASASSHTETRINTNGSGGTVEVKIQKTVNGETVKEEYTKTVEPNEPVRVEVNAEARSEDGIEKATSSVNVNGETQSPQSETKTTGADAAFEISTFFTASVPNFFKRIASFFWDF
jgi:hypothetical protein